MKGIVVESYWFLLRTEFLLCFGRFGWIRELVHKAKTATTTTWNCGHLCSAMDLACVFYPKHILCLQRAVATTLFLRKHGQPAELVVGAQTLPFKSHAWVEVNGLVVNDRPYIRENYHELERW